MDMLRLSFGKGSITTRKRLEYDSKTARKRIEDGLKTDGKRMEDGEENVPFDRGLIEGISKFCRG